MVAKAKVLKKVFHSSNIIEIILAVYADQVCTTQGSWWFNQDPYNRIGKEEIKHYSNFFLIGRAERNEQWIIDQARCVGLNCCRRVCRDGRCPLPGLGCSTAVQTSTSEMRRRTARRQGENAAGMLRRRCNAGNPRQVWGINTGPRGVRGNKPPIVCWLADPMKLNSFLTRVSRGCHICQSYFICKQFG